ncbi:hypothetical protein PRIPAC_77851 [Pristionchus pacificus]|uniref:Uncharacterized protein n=1 Tax=Pristionchus pacificus TaxID=54126 RepID=A0A2A6C2E7_PRIPA|nr:hypothetical protein PRIPAC_77851 [Pristionchus pacificus]|eukprot:PDM72201.1 hypothetical protein PRIPAC_38635 [Pristionchus pacificus]
MATGHKKSWKQSEKFCDSHVDPNVELEPTELEMRELPRPFVDFPLIDYVRLNQRELEHVLKEEDTYSTASTIPLNKCVMITENIIRRDSQGSIWQEFEEDDEEDEEERAAREPERVIVYPDRVEWSFRPILNTDDVTPNDEENDRVTDDIDESEAIAIATNPSKSNVIIIEDDNPSESIAIPIEDNNPSESKAIPIEDD